MNSARKKPDARTTQEIPFEDIQKMQQEVLITDTTTPNLVLSIIENQKKPSVPEVVSIRGMEGDLRNHPIVENSHLQTLLQKAAGSANSSSVEKTTKRRMTRVLHPDVEETDILVCQQVFKDHQGIAGDILAAQYVTQNEGIDKYGQRSGPIIFRELLTAYRETGNMRQMNVVNSEDEIEAIEYCKSNTSLRSFIHPDTKKLIRGYEKTSLAYREIWVDLNVYVCLGLIRDLDEFIRRDLGMEGYYEIETSKNLPDAPQKIASVKVCFYKRGEKEKMFLKKIGQIAERYSRGILSFGDTLNRSGSASVELMPDSFSEKEAQDFFDLVRKIGGNLLHGAIKPFLTHPGSSRGLNMKGKEIIFNKQDLLIVKKVFEDFGIYMAYVKGKGFVLSPISQ